MDVSDSRFDVDKDVVDGKLVREDGGMLRRWRRRRQRRRRMRKLSWRVMITRRRRTLIFYNLRLEFYVCNNPYTMSIISRTLFYFAFNMMNALCMLCFLLDADNLCDGGALAVWYNCEWVF